MVVGHCGVLHTLSKPWIIRLEREKNAVLSTELVNHYANRTLIVPCTKGYI